MNDSSYDEEIVDNIFFVHLQSKHKKLFDSAQDSRYVVRHFPALLTVKLFWKAAYRISCQGPV